MLVPIYFEIDSAINLTIENFILLGSYFFNVLGNAFGNAFLNFFAITLINFFENIFDNIYIFFGNFFGCGIAIIFLQRNLLLTGSVSFILKMVMSFGEAIPIEIPFLSAFYTPNI